MCSMITPLKLRCDERFTHAFTACSCVLKVGSNQGNDFENATVCSKRTLKTTVATQLNFASTLIYRNFVHHPLSNKGPDLRRIKSIAIL